VHYPLGGGFFQVLGGFTANSLDRSPKMPKE
jgi:hypothetical protein